MTVMRIMKISRYTVYATCAQMHHSLTYTHPYKTHVHTHMLRTHTACSHTWPGPRCFQFHPLQAVGIKRICWCDSHVTMKTSMMCAAWNTVITMLLLDVWEVEGGEWRWRVEEVEVGVRRRGRGGKGRK